jgi:hypothetical protein
MTPHIKYRAAGLLAALESKEVGAGPRISYDTCIDKGSRQRKIR